jgi:hypothetical protein
MKSGAEGYSSQEQPSAIVISFKLRRFTFPCNRMKVCMLPFREKLVAAAGSADRFGPG